MHGNDRIYTPMTDKVFNMFINSSQYKAALNNPGYTYNPALKTKVKTTDGKVEYMDLSIYGDTGITQTRPTTMQTAQGESTKNTQVNYSRNLMGENTSVINSLKSSKTYAAHWENAMKNMSKYFGTKDIFSVFFASAEQEYGASIAEHSDKEM